MLATSGTASELDMHEIGYADDLACEFLDVYSHDTQV